jgi:hypothetical protein
VELKNTLICSRVTGSAGQYRPPPQPVTTPRRASSSTQRQNGLDAGTSLKRSDPATQAGGVEPLPSFVRKTNTAICSRDPAARGQ